MASQEQTFFIAGPVGKLEALSHKLDAPEIRGIAVICHPHPLHGGTMHNKVVHTLARAMDDLGLATVRFNFRGIGASDGTYDHTIGETQDLLAVIDWVREHYPDQPLWLGGFSFGGYVALRAASQRPIARLITIAPAVSMFDTEPLQIPDCPWLLVQGDADDTVPHQKVLDWIATLDKPPRTIFLKGVEHFFHGQLVALRKTLTVALAV